MSIPTGTFVQAQPDEEGTYKCTALNIENQIKRTIGGEIQPNIRMGCTFEKSSDMYYGKYDECSSYCSSDGLEEKKYLEWAKMVNDRIRNEKMLEEKDEQISSLQEEVRLFRSVKQEIPMNATVTLEVRNCSSFTKA